MFRRALTSSATSPRKVSFPAPPKYWLNPQKRNAIMAFSLIAFCGSVFYYTLHQLRAANHLGVEFDEKLDKSNNKK
ncbi:hypothetical protein BASA81_003041 [Batrachochytrium salamandrivorans]|nr:hypothetical protein BASA81_003041 [Batrachochytrium salamandrivorans]